jgi:hypothetical protein
VVINEVMWDSKKAGGLLDEDGDLSDWIELHNTSPGDINLEVRLIGTWATPGQHLGDTWVTWAALDWHLDNTCQHVIGSWATYLPVTWEIWCNTNNNS